MKNLKYQQEAVADLTNKTIKALNSGEHRRKIVFEAPTGSGKTVMTCQALGAIVDELKSRGDSLHEECAFIWFAPRKLHIQSYWSIKGAFGDTRKLRPVMFDELEQSEGIRPGEILFVNWESVNKEKNVMARDSEGSASIYEIARRTHEDGELPIVAIIDEEHMYWTKTADKSAQVLDRINPNVEIRVSATPKTLVSGKTQKVIVDRADVIKAQMIKKEVVLNSDIDVDAADPISLEERLLKAALRRRQRIADEYERLGANIKPLLLVQLPNDSKEAMTDDDNKVAEIVKTYLRHNPAEEITTENGKLAVWLAGEKENLAGLEQPDNMAKVLLFKEAIALGWDCPRAAVLLIFRKLASDEFTVQTVGRIMRMPEQKHYPSELLNVGYVYTDIAKDKIRIATADQRYILDNTITATRRQRLCNVALSAVYASRPNAMHNYLGPDFKEVLRTEAEKFFKMESSKPMLFSLEDLADMSDDDEPPTVLAETDDLQIDENRRRAQNIIRLDVGSVNVKIPKDVHFQNDVQVIEVSQVKFARTSNEIDRVFQSYISTKGGQFESRQGDRVRRIAGYLLGLLEDYFGIYGTDAKKVVLYHGNRPKFDRLLDLAFGKYMARRASVKVKRVMTEYVWEVPGERLYDGDTHQVVPEAVNHGLLPFVKYNDASRPEDRFVAFLERHGAKIDWWYKNGDKGRTHYAIAYNDDDALFYPDFVVRMKSGRVYIFDTKTAGSDAYAAEKHNALVAYLRAERAKGIDICGGVIIEATPDCWLYSKDEIANTTDLSDWAMLDFND